MRFSHVAAIYFLMGVVVVGAGVVPAGGIGIAEVFIDVDGADVETNDTAIGAADHTGEGSDGLLSSLAGPVKNGMNTLTGGALLAVWGPLSTLAGYYAWPVSTAVYLGAPTVVQMLAGVFVLSFTMGTLRVFKSSV